MDGLKGIKIGKVRSVLLWAELQQINTVLLHKAGNFYLNR